METFDDLKSIYEPKDYERLEDKVIDACTCICGYKVKRNPSMTRTDAISNFSEWVKDDKKSTIYRKLCETILKLYKERKD